MTGYHAHGITIDSELPLPLATGNGSPPDLVLRGGDDRPVPAERPDGEPLAELRDSGGGLRYVLARDGERTTLRYPSLCEFTGDRDLGRVAAHRHPGSDAGLLPVLATGGLLAAHLMLRHRLVLHASAVETAGRAVAFVGASGMGKSTIATALCGTGCRLVSDDLLRVHVTATAATVYPGSIETRLRPGARPLAGDPATARATADGRLAVMARARATRPLPLGVCVVPVPSRSASRAVVRRLSPARALLRLSQFPRVLGWREPASLDRAFQALADLAERVPVFEATIPWGPPFARATLNELLAEVGQR